MNFVIALFALSAVFSAVTGQALAAVIALVWLGICLYARRKFAELEQGSDTDKDPA